MTVSTDELLDIIASAGLRLQREIKLAYKAGTLDEYLVKIGMEDLYPQKSSVEWDDAFPNGKIVIIGDSTVRDRDIFKSIESVGISRDRVELRLGYDDRSNEEFIRTLRYNNKYRLILVGPMPHSTTATGDYSSAGGADIFLDLHRNTLHLSILYWTHTAKGNFNSFFSIPMNILIQYLNELLYGYRCPRAIVK